VTYCDLDHQLELERERRKGWENVGVLVMAMGGKVRVPAEVVAHPPRPENVYWSRDVVTGDWIIEVR
jgi:hypothetical protein